MLLSGNFEDIRVVRRYAQDCLRVEHFDCTEVFETTDWAKYIHNCILPVQLSFLNEIYDLIGDQKQFDQSVQHGQKWFRNDRQTYEEFQTPDGITRIRSRSDVFPKDTAALSQLRA